MICKELLEDKNVLSAIRHKEVQSFLAEGFGKGFVENEFGSILRRWVKLKEKNE